MKKLLTILTAMGFALTLGVAFADESPSMANDMGGKLYNGITYFDTGPGCALSEESGSAAGGSVEEESSAVVSNGITHFEAAGSIAKGSCVSRLGEEGLNIENGVTYFGPRTERM